MKKTPNRTRKIPVQIYFDEEEISFIEKKMKAANIKNKSEYIRQMCLYGKVVTFDDLNFRYCLTEMKKIGTNLNQMTKIANRTNSIYKKDIRYLKEYFDILNRIISKMCMTLDKLLKTVKQQDFYTMTEQIEQVVSKLKKEKYLE